MFAVIDAASSINTAIAPDLAWIGESCAETIHEALSSYGLLTLSREDRVEVYRRLGVKPEVLLTRATVMKIGQTLDAGQVVFGDYTVDAPAAGVPAVKSHIRIVVHVIDLKKLKEAESFEQEGVLENLSQMEMALAWQVLRLIAPSAAASEETFRRFRPATPHSAENRRRPMRAYSPCNMRTPVSASLPP